MTNPHVLSALSQDQLVAIVGVDVSANTARGQTKQRAELIIDTRYLVGSVHVVPAVGEQWFIKRLGANWVLERKLPFNTDHLATVADNPVEGQMQIGSSGGVSAGPLHLLGSQINANAPLRLHSAATTDLPDAGSFDPGSAMWDSAQNKMVISDGLDWRDTAGTIVLAARQPILHNTGTLTATVLRRFFPRPQFMSTGTLHADVGYRAAGHGHGVLTAAARMYQLRRAPNPLGQGVLSATTHQHCPLVKPFIGNGQLTVALQSLTPYRTAGTYSYPVSIGTLLDLVCVGGGGGGGVNTLNGNGGTGSPSTAMVGATIVSGAGGIGGDANYDTAAPYSYGQAAGNEVFDSKTYVGGTQDTTLASLGHAPGGGGVGGFTFGTYYGNGGKAGAWAAQTVMSPGYGTVSITVGAGGVGHTAGGAGIDSTAGASGAVFIYAY